MKEEENRNYFLNFPPMFGLFLLCLPFTFRIIFLMLVYLYHVREENMTCVFGLHSKQDTKGKQCFSFDRGVQ